MRKRVHKLVWGGALAATLALSGCIQPNIVEKWQTETAQAVMMPPTAPPPVFTAPPPPPSSAATSLPPSAMAVADQFVRQRGDVPANLFVWYEGALGPDHLVGFSYTGMAGTPCSGYVLLAYQAGIWSPNNGATACAPQADAMSQAAFTFILTSDGQPYTTVFGRVQDPTVTAVAAVYDDGGTLSASVVGGGFMLVRPVVVSPTTLTAIDALGNTVITAIPFSPV